MFVTRRLAFLSLSLLCSIAAHAAGPLALLTSLDGEARLLRGAQKFALVEGTPLQPDDIVETGPQSRLARLEFADGATLALGPASRALLAPRLTGAQQAGAQAYLLSGWAKATGAAPAVAKVLSPALDFSTGGTALLEIAPDTARLFAESGEAQARRAAAEPRALRSGEMLAVVDGKLEVSRRPPPAFVQAMPRAFMDTLPARAAHFKGKNIEPRPLGALTYADAQPWLDAEPALRRAYLPRWRPLVRDAEFRRSLQAGLKAHPEWGPVLNPPPPRTAAAR